MYDENPHTLLNMRRLPAQVDCSGAGALLNFKEAAINALVDLGLLKPLGNPRGQEHKRFATIHILKLGEDPKWLDQANRALRRHWAARNRKNGFEKLRRSTRK